MNFRTGRVFIFCWLLLAQFGSFAKEQKNDPSGNAVSWPVYRLSADKIWLLNPPNGERFDASALLWRKSELLTVSDRGHGVYRIQFSNNSNEADLVLVPNWFTAEQMKPFAYEKIGRWDCEGLAMDSTHRIYICEEANRWIFRFDPKKNSLQRLEINWSPFAEYFHPTDINASFEGVAVGKGKLFVANERQKGRIFVVHLKSGKVIDHFTVRPSSTKAKDIHYSDLCWFENSLWALLRENNTVVKIDPGTKQILAEFNYRDLEHSPGSSHKRQFSSNIMEGLAVDKNFIWLIADKNGSPQRKLSDDIRPELFRIRRPDK